MMPVSFRARKRRGLIGDCRGALSCIAVFVALGTAAAQPPPRTLVVPFENAQRLSRLYWVSEAAAVLLTDRLEAAGRPAVSREERLRAFERLGVPSTATLTDATIIKVGQLLAADAVVMGSFTLSGETLSVRARRIALVSGRMEAEIQDEGPLTDIVRVFERVATRLGGLVGGKPAAAAYTQPALAAFEPFIKGLLAETPAGQVKYLVTALALDPAYDPARIALWHAYSADGDHERALRSVLAVPADSRLSRRAGFLAALSELRLKHYDQAHDRLGRLGTDATVLNNLGVVEMRRGEARGLQNARYYFQKALETDPDDPDYRFNMGYASYLAKDRAAAVTWLRDAVRRDPADGEAHYLLGTVLLETGAQTEGNRERDLALRLSSVYQEWGKRPAGDPVPRGLERVKEDLEPSRLLRSEQAFVVAEQREHAELASFHLERGRRLFAQENDREAVEELRRSLYLLPYQAEAHLLLGRIYLRTGRIREAIDTLKISLWSEETAAGHLALAEAYFQAHELEPALSEAERALALDPRSDEARKLISKIKGEIDIRLIMSTV
ncbi:MAG: tetratricopeptide repeat protein [Vicinamibacterales bacterium]